MIAQEWDLLVCNNNCRNGSTAGLAGWVWGWTAGEAYDVFEAEEAFVFLSIRLKGKLKIFKALENGRVHLCQHPHEFHRHFSITIVFRGD